MKWRRLIGFIVLYGATANSWAQSCEAQGTWLQVLGSGTTELSDGRSGSSYLLWIDGKARLLLDSGPGSAQNFIRSGASIADLAVIAYSHLHVDHGADLPALIQATANHSRRAPLPIYGPSGNPSMPSTVSCTADIPCEALLDVSAES